MLKISYESIFMLLLGVFILLAPFILIRDTPDALINDNLFSLISAIIILFLGLPRKILFVLFFFFLVGSFGLLLIFAYQTSGAFGLRAFLLLNIILFQEGVFKIAQPNWITQVNNEIKKAFKNTEFKI